MKTKFRVSAMLVMVAMLFTVFIVSCSDDGDTTPATDFTALKASIAAATTVSTGAVEGKNDGQYPTGSKTALTASITAAQALVDSPATTQTMADNAKVSLDQAVTAFQALVIKPIAAENLIAYWSFDEGTGTTINDASANKFTGTFKTGPAGWGAGTAAWAKDRTGANNKALSFDKGGNVEVPYNTKLNPAQMTVSVWVNPAETRADNRFLGLQSWIGYKFQLQATNRPYFTINTDQGTREEDATVELPLNAWHHIVATFGGGSLIFYIDGVMVKTWDKPGNGKALAKQYNLVIGQDFPTDKYSSGDGTNFDKSDSPDYQVIPLAWGGYYHGSLDELRMYNTVLTASQVASLYDREKP